MPDSADYPDINGLALGTRWYSKGRGPERMVILRGLRVGTVTRGRRMRVFAIIEHSSFITEMDVADFVNEWWRATSPLERPHAG